MRLTSPIVAGLAAVPMALSPVLPFSPARAALPDAVVRSAPSPADSTPTRSAGARCPEGTRVTGGGGRIIGGAGKVVLVRLQPIHTNNLDRYEATAIESEPYDGVWQVEAYAVCAPGVPGIGIREDTIEIDDPMPPGGSAGTSGACANEGATLISVGGRAYGGHGRLHLDRMEVFGASQTPTVSASVGAQGTVDPITVSAYTVCGDLPPESTEPVEGQSALDSAAVKQATATCPAGMAVTGTGGEITTDREIVLEALVPEILPGNVPGDQVTVTAREAVPTGDDWRVRATAFCAA
jgi:hypothetical protein